MHNAAMFDAVPAERERDEKSPAYAGLVVVQPLSTRRAPFQQP
jgi:hypothetical protein